MKHIVQMVKCGRAAMGITQQEMADAIGVGKATVARFETGTKTKYPTVGKMLGLLTKCTFVETADGFVMTYKNEA
jgi:predicted transcriptional regulator